MLIKTGRLNKQNNKKYEWTRHRKRKSSLWAPHRQTIFTSVHFLLSANNIIHWIVCLSNNSFPNSCYNHNLLTTNPYAIIALDFRRRWLTRQLPCSSLSQNQLSMRGIGSSWNNRQVLKQSTQSSVCAHKRFVHFVHCVRNLEHCTGRNSSARPGPGPFSLEIFRPGPF